MHPVESLGGPYRVIVDDLVGWARKGLSESSVSRKWTPESVFSRKQLWSPLLMKCDDLNASIFKAIRFHL